MVAWLRSLMKRVSDRLDRAECHLFGHAWVLEGRSARRCSNCPERQVMRSGGSWS